MIPVLFLSLFLFSCVGENDNAPLKSKEVLTVSYLPLEKENKPKRNFFKVGIEGFFLNFNKDWDCFREYNHFRDDKTNKKYFVKLLCKNKKLGSFGYGYFLPYGGEDDIKKKLSSPKVYLPHKIKIEGLEIENPESAIETTSKILYMPRKIKDFSKNDWIHSVHKAVHKGSILPGYVTVHSYFLPNQSHHKRFFFEASFPEKLGNKNIKKNVKDIIKNIFHIIGPS